MESSCQIRALSGILVIVYKKQKKYKRVMEMLDRLELKAYGKINLGLDVVRKREDGYHEVRMIMQTVHLHDRIVMEKTKEPGIRTETNLPYVPDGEGNLAWRAAKLLMDEFGLSEGVDIKIRKCIPVAAGMAGGSTDAAAVLVGMNRLFGLGLGKRELMRAGSEAGSGHPLLYPAEGPPCRRGSGRSLRSFPGIPSAMWCMAKPQISVSTKAVYEKLRVDALGPEAHPDIDGMAAAIRAGSLDGVTARLGNVLETVTIPDHPEIGAIKRIMLEHGAEGAPHERQRPHGIWDL